MADSTLNDQAFVKAIAEHLRKHPAGPTPSSVAGAKEYERNLILDHFMEEARKPMFAKDANTQNGCYTGVVLSRDEKKLVQEINRMSQVVHSLEHLGENAPRVGERVRISYAAQVPTISKLQPELKQTLSRGLHV